MRGDGDGWVFDTDGTRYWGVHGAAGLLLYVPGGPDATPPALVLLQHRAPWSHLGGTWGLPGGARDSHESAEQAAVREAGEEAGIGGAQLRVRESVVTHRAGDWSYTTVLATVSEPLATVANGESVELRWFPVPEIARLPLHPGFARAWPDLARLLS